jgi:hypothetical protein
LTLISSLGSCPADGPAGLEGALPKKYRTATVFNTIETDNRMSKDLFEVLVFFSVEKTGLSLCPPPRLVVR